MRFSQLVMQFRNKISGVVHFRETDFHHEPSDYLIHELNYVVIKVFDYINSETKL